MTEERGSNGSRISCAAQRRQRYAQELVRYAARRKPATIGATLGRVSCMRLLDLTLADEPGICLGNGKPERPTKRKYISHILGGRLVTDVTEDLNLG